MTEVSTAGMPAPAQQLFALLRGEMPADILWDDVGVYAIALGLGPLLLENAIVEMPPVLASRLRLATQRTAARTSALLDALHDLLGAGEELGLRLIVLKGAYLAPEIYGNLGLRGMSDIDLLVQPDDFPGLQSVFGKLGYKGKFTSSKSGPGIVKHEWTYKLGGGDAMAANPYFGGEGFHVEPHTSLVESWFGLSVDVTPGVWESTTAWTLRNSQGQEQAALALSAEHALLHGAVHLVFHLLMGKPAFAQLYDIRRLLEMRPDLRFDVLAAKAQSAESIPHLLATLRLTFAAYAAPVPVEWFQELNSLCPPRQRERAMSVQLADMWAMTQQPPLTKLHQRLQRGVRERALAASWARSYDEAWKVWRSVLLFYRTDTAQLLKGWFTS